MILNQCETEHIKITVEELDGHRYIATYWLKGDEEETDRTVRECRTPGEAYRWAFNWLKQYYGSE